MTTKYNIAYTSEVARHFFSVWLFCGFKNLIVYYLSKNKNTKKYINHTKKYIIIELYFLIC